MCSVRLYRSTAVGESVRQAASGSHFCFFLFRSKIPLYLNLLSPDKNTYSEKLYTHSRTHSVLEHCSLSVSSTRMHTHTHTHLHLNTHTHSHGCYEFWRVFILHSDTTQTLAINIFLSLTHSPLLNASTHSHTLMHAQAHARTHTHRLSPSFPLSVQL